MPRRLGSLSLVLATAVAVAACAAEPETDDARFALTHAQVRVTGDEQYGMNLLFLDDPRSPVWDRLEAVTLDDVDVLDFTVVAGDQTDHGRLGNLMLDVAPGRDVRVDEIELHYATSSRTHEIGTWHFLERPQEDPIIEVARDYVAAYPSTDAFEAQVVNRSEEDVTLGAPVFGNVIRAEDVLVDGAPADAGTVRVRPGETVMITARLAPHSADFLVVTPQIPVHRADGSVVETYLPEANMGMISITPEKVSAIASRS